MKSIPYVQREHLSSTGATVPFAFAITQTLNYRCPTMATKAGRFVQRKALGGNLLAIVPILVGSAVFPCFVSAASSDTGLEEITVTARRVAESSQKTPVAVSAVTADQIDKGFVADTSALAQFAPNVIFDRIEAGTPAGGAFSIRGISYQDVEKLFDPTVLVVVDNVVRGTGEGNVMSMLDVESVEVLRGPQGTLFGKNAVGGLINIHRRMPQLGKTFAQLRGTGGNYDTKNIEGYANLGLEKVAVKFTSSYLDHGGYFPDRALGPAQGDREEFNIGSEILFKPMDTVSLRLSYDYKRITGTPAPTINISDRRSTGADGDLLCSAFGQCAPGPGQAQGGDNFASYGTSPVGVSLKEHFVTGEANWEFTPTYTATYILGYLKADDFVALDSDGSPVNFFEIYRNGTYKQFSHELRLAHSGTRLSWQSGLYYWDVKSHDVQVANHAQSDDYGGTSKSKSVYGEADYHILDHLILTAGARWIEETKTIEKQLFDIPSGTFLIAPGTGSERTDSKIIWRGGLRYEFTDDLMAYFTYSTGFRSGVFSARSGTLATLLNGAGPESLKNYELGAKSTWLGGRLRANVTLFHMLYDQMQIESNIPGPTGGQQSGIFNIGRATIDGAEFELAVKPTSNWTLTANVGLLDAKYDQFFTDLYGTGTPMDFSHVPLRRAPDQTAAASSTYNFPLPQGTGTFRVGYNWTSDYADTVNDNPGTHISSFGLLDASLSYDSEKNWTIGIFGNNLTNEDAWTHTYAVVPNPQGGTLWKFANPRTPRTYGARLTYRFGDT